MFRERTIRVEGLDISLRIFGARADTVDTVLLHGIPGSAATWDKVLSRKPDNGRVIVPDLAGFGRSSRTNRLSDLHAEGQARRLERALRAASVERALLVGHDFGGPVAVRLYMRASAMCAGMLLASTNVLHDTPIPFPLSLVKAPLVGPALSNIMFSRTSLAFMCRFGAKRAELDSTIAIGDAQQAEAIRRIFAGSLTSLEELYRPIDDAVRSCYVPVSVVWGDRDPFFPVEQAERTAAAIPGASLHILQGTGHFLPDEAPDEMAAHISDLAGRINNKRGPSGVNGNPHSPAQEATPVA